MAVKEGALSPHYESDEGDNGEDITSNDEYEYSTTTEAEEGNDADTIHSICSTSLTRVPDILNADQDGLYQYQNRSSVDLEADQNSNLGESIFRRPTGSVQQNAVFGRRSHERNSNANGPLSRAALSLLHRASHRVGAAVHPQTAVGVNSLVFGRDTTCRMLNASLHRELASLKQQIPSFKKRAAKSSCVIAETLEYLDSLRKNVRDLEHFIGNLATVNAVRRIQSDASNTANDVVLELNRLEDGDIKIIVNCRKRPGLMGDIVMALESLDLILDSMNVSCQGSRFIFQAVAASEEICTMLIGEEDVRRAVLNAICNTSNIH